jgi:hypothetical protein
LDTLRTDAGSYGSSTVGVSLVDSTEVGLPADLGGHLSATCESGCGGNHFGLIL